MPMLVQTILRTFAQITVCILVVLYVQSARATDLSKDLTTDEFTAAGLTKLTSNELEILQRLLNKTQVSVATIPALGADNPQAINTTQANENSPEWRPKAIESERSVIETEVTDAFKGLFGSTKITLANGQIWQQTDNAIFDRKLRNNRVRIKPAILGRWRLQFIDNNLSFTVKRVQ
jgi:hypothetical protein